MCLGSGECATCRDHLARLQTFARECLEGNLGAAEAAIARALQEVGNSETYNKNFNTVAGAGAGAFIGTLLFPGVGTLIGGLLGKAMGEGSNVAQYVDWQRADLYFAAGVLYSAGGRRSEATQAWIKALTFKEDHEPARLALKEVI